DVILGLRAEGRTVFFSTHILPDAEALCDRVALLREGHLAAVGRLDEILSIDVEHLEVLVGGVEEALVQALPTGVRARHAIGERRRAGGGGRGPATRGG